MEILSKEGLKQQMIWYMDKHSAIKLYNLLEESIYERAELLYNPTPLEEAKPQLQFNYLNQDKIKKDDPLLNYVLTHELPNGMQRNAVVFKNLAPILVALKLDKNSHIINKIISNCHGKKRAELEGWLKKARRGELHLNKYEINRWCKKHGIL